MKNTTVIGKSQKAQAIEEFHISESLERVRQKWALFKKQFYASDVYQQYIASKQKLNQQVYRPITTVYKNTYNELPPQATKMKFSMLEKFSYKERFIFLNFLTLGSAVLTMRGISRFNAFDLGIKSLRNASLTYVLGGLIIAPEIYNPVLLKQKEERYERY